MKTYTYSESRQRLARLLDEATREGQVGIRRQDGSTFTLQPVVQAGPPPEVPGVRTRLRRGELVDLLRSARRRSAAAVVEALPNRRLPKRKAPRRAPSGRCGWCCYAPTIRSWGQ